MSLTNLLSGQAMMKLLTCKYSLLIHINQMCNYCQQYRVGRYFDILIYRDISNRDYRIEAKNLSDILSKLSSCSMAIVILLRNIYSLQNPKQVESIFAFQQQIYPQKVY